MNPGSTSWSEAVPAILVAATLLFVPGTVAALLLRLPWLTAVGIGPVVSTTLLVGGGVVCGAADIAWGLLPVVATAIAGWLVAAVAGVLVRRWSGRGSGDRVGSAEAGDRGGSAEAGDRVGSAEAGDRVETDETGDTTRPRGLFPLATFGGLALTLAAVAAVLVRVTVTPDHFPQHPDTIFHLGDALWMVQNRDASVLHAFAFFTDQRGSTYPAAFHVVTSTTALLTGTNIVVATQSAVLVMGGLVWPAGLILLGCAVFGRRAEVVGATAVASVLFTAFPFTIMGFGVLWPNLFGQAMLPAMVATALAVLARAIPHRSPVARALPAALVTVVGLPGLTLAHPNALVTLLVLGFLIVATTVLRRAWDGRDRRALALALVGALLVVTAAVAAVSVVIRPASMVRTGAPGPELGWRRALVDTVLFGPRQGQSLVLLTVIAGIGAISLLRKHRGTGWLPLAATVFAVLYLVNVAVDDPSSRYLTWPWYNNAIRLAVAGSLPSALCAAAGFLAVGHLLGRLLRRLPEANLVGTAVVVVAFLGLTHGYVGAHRSFLDGYYRPDTAHSWATDAELRGLTSLATHIPKGAVTAANAWNGGTYLYIVSGKPLLVPTEKALLAGDRTLLAARLDEAGTSAEVCAAARRQHVEFAITGGQPFAWAGKARVALYSGIDSVGSSPAFTKVATAGGYTLYRLTTCAS